MEVYCLVQYLQEGEGGKECVELPCLAYSHLPYDPARSCCYSAMWTALCATSPEESVLRSNGSHSLEVQSNTLHVRICGLAHSTVCSLNTLFGCVLEEWSECIEEMGGFQEQR